MTKKINKLPEDVISKVAAGEVVENPGSVIKELIENSIDANATQINIEVFDSGFEKIIIIDDGEGMDPDDIKESVERHTTSKIKEYEDLNAIRSFGFRGEALHSMATTSKLTLQSKMADSLAGYELKVNGGKAGEFKPLGMPDGTMVIVEDLFYNVPARKKFVKSKQAEFRKIVDNVTRFALAHPGIGFKLKHNNKAYLHFGKNQEHKDRMLEVLGKDVHKNLIKVSAKEDDINIEGYISKPQNSFPNKDLQFLYVNGRYVVNKEISRIIKESYGSLLEPRMYPAFVLFINIPPEDIDVNIHPRKREIKFADPEKLFSQVRYAVQNGLGISDLTYKMNDEVEEFEEFLHSGKERDNKDISTRKANKYIANILKEETAEWNIKTNKNKTKKEEIIQINDLYLIVENEKGITIIDQHAAHERILYEEFLQKFIEKRDEKEIVEINKTFELPYNLVPLLEDNIEVLATIGFTIENFGKNTYKFTTIPKLFEKHDLTGLIIEILGDLEQNGDPKKADEKSLQTISYTACRLAIKGGDYLTMEERRNLIEKLENTKTGYTCPHGRPVRVDISFGQLRKMFKRA
jgi:DNA mismatch repair protein MutL